MKKLLTKASSVINNIPQGKFEKYNLSENPFPLTPIVNRDSDQKKFNGSIYAREIRQTEYEKFLNNFVKVPQADIDHLRLGFVVDSSYIGRGNGKSAFFVNLLREINEEFSINLSDGKNKCFGVHFAPEPSGNTKTFKKFVDGFFDSIIQNNIIDHALAILRIEALIQLKGDDVINLFQDDSDLVKKLNDEEWYTTNDFTNLNLWKNEIASEIFKNEFLQQVSETFPLARVRGSILAKIINQNDFYEYYSGLKREEDKLQFVFSDLVSMFLAAGFNGCFAFVDDFERIPVFQSLTQRRDFITYLRAVLYDGVYLNSRIGFYNFIFALHAGVPRLIQEVWAVAGLEQRVPLNPTYHDPKHIILFDKIDENDVRLLLEKYLREYRIDTGDNIKKGLYPFTEEAVRDIGINCEFNASKILQFSCNIIDYAAGKNFEEINGKVVNEFSKNSTYKTEEDTRLQDISKVDSVDLMQKAKDDE